MRACERCLPRPAMGPDAAWKLTMLAFAREIEGNGLVQRYAVRHPQLASPCSLEWLRLVGGIGEPRRRSRIRDRPRACGRDIAARFGGELAFPVTRRGGVKMA